MASGDARALRIQNAQLIEAILKLTLYNPPPLLPDPSLAPLPVAVAPAYWYLVGLKLLFILEYFS